MRCSWICELKQEENFTGICNNILIYHHLVQTGEEQHTYCVTVQKASIEICSRKYLWEDQHFYQSYSLQELFKGFSAFLENGSFFKTNFADIFWNVHFFCETIYIDCQRQWAGCALKFLAEFLKTVFDKGHFIVNLFYQISIKNGKMTWNIS